MTLERQLLLLFTAIGSLNGFFLTVYFTFLVKKRGQATLLLTALLAMVSLRILKSTLVIVDEDLSGTLSLFGLAACFLIGPFLFLYIKAARSDTGEISNGWLFHILPVALLLAFASLSFSGYSPWWHSKWLSGILYLQWFAYTLISGVHLRQSFKTLVANPRKLTDEETWLLGIVLAIGAIWLAYTITNYTNYIIGGWSFSLIFYVLLFVWLYKRRNITAFFEKPVKYGNKKISAQEADAIAAKLDRLFTERELHKNPNLKLSDVADALAVSPHYLSQYLNDNLGQHFPAFVNAYRVKAAEEMLRKNHQFTLEAIGYKCGFKSNSSFYTAFKKIKEMTPAQYKKDLK